MKYIDNGDVERLINDYKKNGVIPRRKNIFYRGLENTLNANFYYILNDNEKVEWAKCYNDIIYFTEKYLDLKLRKYQIEWLNLYNSNRFIIYNVARQTGITRILSIIYLHEMIFNGKSIYHKGVKKSSDCEFFDIIKHYYLKIPIFLKPSLVSLNSLNISLTNGGTINGGSISHVAKNYDIWSLFDFAYSDKQLEEYCSLLPNTVYNGESRMIITSTPNGKNYFYDLYKNSIKKEGDPYKNNFKSIQTFWWEVEGRDEKWKSEEIKNLGSIDKFNQEHNLEF